MPRSLNGLTFLARGRGSRVFTLLVLAAVLGLVPSLIGGRAFAQAPGRADMAVASVSDDPDPVLINQTVTYFVSVENRGPSQATGVELTAALPSGVRFEPAQSDAPCIESGGLVTCSFASWPANAAGILRIAVTPSAAGVLQLTFTVRAAERDPDPSNNSQTETTVVVEPTEAEVSIDLPTSVEGYAGQNFIWLSVEVRNGGPASATGLTVTLQFPSGLSQGYGGGVCTDTGSGQSCTYAIPGSVPAGSGVVDLIGVAASAAGSYTVSGSVTADQPDPVLSDNSDSTLVTVTPAADVSAQIADSTDPATPGTAIAYTVTVTNHGPSPASAVALTDSWSATVSGGVQLLSFATTQGQCALTGNRIDCQLGGLASGATATVTVTVRPRGTGSITDQAQVSAAEFDPDTANNADSETTTVGSA
jgi:uncharacterized repeat protein (TIGR01451 family)